MVHPNRLKIILYRIVFTRQIKLRGGLVSAKREKSVTIKDTKYQAGFR
jgi:hypothetical protein